MWMKNCAICARLWRPPKIDMSAIGIFDSVRIETDVVASLDHPNILPIYEVSEGEDGLPFFSMKFAAGGSLLDAAPALRNEPRRSVELMAKVARAVQYAHSHGILHRDLKPGNIL